MQEQRKEYAMLSKKTRTIRALIGLAIMPCLLLFKPLFAKALNLAEFTRAGLNLIFKFESALYF